MLMIYYIYTLNSEESRSREAGKNGKAFMQMLESFVCGFEITCARMKQGVSIGTYEYH
jgi:hypothetical protein